VTHHLKEKAEDEEFLIYDKLDRQESESLKDSLEAIESFVS